MWLRWALLSGALCGCEQIVGIEDPGGFGVGPGADAMRDASSATDANLPGLCAPTATLATPNNFSAPGAKQVAIGELTGDGVPDLAYADGSDIKIYPGTGGGNVGAIRQLTPGTAVNTNGLIVADVDGDGLQDVIATDGVDQPTGDMGANTIKVFRQSPAGTFAQVGTTINFNAGGDPMLFVHPANFNGDGKLDLVAVSPQATQVFLGTATAGTFTGPTTINTTEPALVVTDVDGDTFDDVVFTPNSGGVKLVYTKTAAPGTFDTPVTIGNGNRPAMAFGHFSPTGASRKDAIVGQNTGALFVQTAPRAFNLTDSSVVAMFDTGGGIAFEMGQTFVVDFNGDGKDDIVMPRFYTVQCDPLGKFYPDPDAFGQNPLMLDMSDPGPRRVALGNLDGNSKIDMVTISSNFLKVYIQ